MEKQHQVHILICYAPADSGYLNPLKEEFQRLSKGHDYLEVDHIDTANTSAAFSRNQTLLQNSDIVVILLSSSFLQGTFYHRWLKNNPGWRRRKEVITLLVHPCQWQHEFFFTPDQEELEEATMLQQAYNRNYSGFLIRLAGRAVGAAYVISRINYLREQQVLVDAERSRPGGVIRRLLLAGKIFSGALFASALIFILYKESFSFETADTGRQRGPDNSATIVDSLVPSDEKNFKTQEKEKTRKSVRGDSTLYKEYYPVGEGRIAALQKDPLGWRLLDTNWLPVNDRLYRRMYHRQGFRQGRMVVKYKDKFYYINPQGRHLADKVPAEYIDLP
jgi:hypothetical protein